ncbi:oxidoreductase [Paenibacillus alginolyticus]|uniref:oxidoreductase n=1 Tax=Paenibacillus alginolyticus TaxID=59839 RepID=UPI0004103132|nr:oxidoreductase [Paenibacillus alginolyticus]MCY9664304.1 oxidoreductase [Paenibacillus alginolyticus]
MGNELRVGLIGYGYAGRTFHAPVISAVSDLKLAKVVQRRGASAKERYPWVEVVDHVQDLYRDDSIDLIVVTTPSTDHYEFVKDALQAGKNVIVEKPFTVTTDEADKLITLAKAKGKVLSVFHNRRWDGDFLTVREIVRQGILGRISEAEFCWDSYRPSVGANWRDSGAPGTGVFYDLGVHFLDQALSLFGMPATIQADVRTIRENAIADDYFNVVLGYEDGLSVRLKSSALVRERGPRYTLHGTNGSYVKYGIDPQEQALIHGETPLKPNWGAEPEDMWGTLNTSIGGLHYIGRIRTIPGSYTSYFQNVYNAIIGQKELEVKPEQARMAIRLIELGIKSNNEKKTVEVTP